MPYHPRRIEFRHRAHLDGWTLKLYAITAPGGRVDAELRDHALRVAGPALPSPAVAPGRPGAGFVVVHATAERTYVLVSWWAEQNEVHQRVFSAPTGHSGHLAPHASPAIGCVWELAVTDFERRAWLTHVLARPDGPDLAAYLAQELSDDV
jgi:hypothetical protein